MDVKMEEELKGIERKIVAVTGGMGFVGSAVCLELLRRGALQVRSFDHRTLSPWSDCLKDSGVHCIQGDVVHREEVEEGLRGAECVFHLASYGRSGKESLQTGRIDEVNIEGTRNVVEACVKHGVTRLVYLSTNGVVFGGRDIENGDEALPYLASDEYVDPYSRSKSVAEQLVLTSNGRPVESDEGKLLRTCAIRSALVYGPGEERHLPRIISNARLGLLLFKIGDVNVKTDWIYVDNLVLALTFASSALVSENPRAAGKAYFVSDGHPINSFEFLRPLLRNLDYDLPKLSLSVPRALFLGRMFEVMYASVYILLNQWWIPQPLILPAEVYEIGVTHYYSIWKAEEELKYLPKTTPEEGMAKTISHFQDKKRREVDGPSIYAWLFCLIGLPGIVAVAWLPDIGPVPFFRAISLFFYRSMLAMRVMSIFFVAAHIVEGIYAWYLARRVDPKNAKTWFWQTLVLATFSLRFLWKRAKETKQC